MFKIIWRAKYLLHDVLSTNHDCQAVTVAKVNYPTVLKYFTELQFDECCIHRVVEYGNLPVLIWLYNRGAKCECIIDWAAYCGHLPLVIWLYENRTEEFTTDAMDGAAQYGHLPVVVWLYENTDIYDIESAKMYAKTQEIEDFLNSVS